MAKANPLGNLESEEIRGGDSSGPADQAEHSVVRGSSHPAPGPSSRSDIELRKAGLSDMSEKGDSFSEK